MSRYGVSVRKGKAEIKREKTANYTCPTCGWQKVKRISTGIWKCRHCGNTIAGAAYTLSRKVR